MCLGSVVTKADGLHDRCAEGSNLSGALVVLQERRLGEVVGFDFLGVVATRGEGLGVGAGVGAGSGCGTGTGTGIGL